MHKLKIDCESCRTGDCCQEGVDVDVEEAKHISQLKLSIKKPWFEDFFKDESSPSGWAVGTIVRNNRCIFQDKNKKCLIYDVRPRYCREFPHEGVTVAPFYKELCNKGKVTKINRSSKKDS